MDAGTTLTPAADASGSPGKRTTSPSLEILAMATIRDILAAKGGNVVQIGPDATAYAAAVAMKENRIGGLVVRDGSTIHGMITERDILRRVVVEKRNPEQTKVREIMTADVICCHPHTNIDEARVVMKERRIRHLPVINEQGELCGLISIGDLNAHDAHSKDVTIHLLNQYIHGFTGTAGEG
jgi:CBS domain-containing protein